MSTVLGIDIGTQNVKAVLYDIDTQQCSAWRSAPLALHQTKTGIAEQEAQWWIDGLHAAVNQLEPNLRAAWWLSAYQGSNTASCLSIGKASRWRP